MKSLILIAAVVGLAHGYASGPPVGVAGDGDTLCIDMFPKGHRDKEGKAVIDQTWTAPYEILTSTAKNCYKGGQTIEVMIKVTNASYYFEGYFAQVQKGQVNTVNHGTFAVFSNDEYSKTLDCFNKTASAIGQSNKEHFISRKFKWTAPADLTGDVYLRYTLVKNQRTFWTAKEHTFKYDAACAAGTALGNAEIQPDESSENKVVDDEKGDAISVIPMFLVSILTLFFAIAMP